MFIVLLSYIKPILEVERFVSEHRAYLESHYASGDFILSGRKEPRTGGVILARVMTRQAIETIIMQDPFHREQIANYEIIEFLPTMTAPQLQNFKVL
jgi:uncharacterized protein YciI